jgi:hypothetical protein
MMKTVRFKLSRNALIGPGRDGRAGEIVEVEPETAAQLISCAAGELADPSKDRAAVQSAVRAFWAEQARLGKR